jgi:hypothetical protein
MINILAEMYVGTAIQQPYSLAVEISCRSELLGARLSVETIAKKLKEACGVVSAQQKLAA